MFLDPYVPAEAWIELDPTHTPIGNDLLHLNPGFMLTGETFCRQ